jgi:hypothetical protein
MKRSDELQHGAWPEHDPRAGTSTGDWAEEAREEALARAPGFGRRFFAGLADRFPAVNATAVFLRWSVQPQDVYAVVGLPSGGFGVQIDPDLEYVIVRTAAEWAEFGDWDGDQVGPALAYVAEILAGGARAG